MTFVLLVHRKIHQKQKQKKIKQIQHMITYVKKGAA